MATATNLVPHRIFLAGRWVDSPDLLTVENPARPGEPAGLTYQAPPEQFADAIRQVNASYFGLRAGVFTNDLAHAFAAFDELEVGGVILNDIPTYRIDHMPYGGVKDSGLGREGLRHAIEDMTEIRILVVAQPG